MIKSDKEDLSPILDLSHKKVKRLTKAIEASRQPQAKATRVIKRPAALTIREPNPEDMSKIAATLGESDHSTPGDEGKKVRINILLCFLLLFFSFFD